MITAITHLSLFVHDQEEALAYFTQKLGFSVHTDHQFDGMRWLTINLPEQPNFELCLMPPSTEEEKKLVGKQGGSVPLCALQTTDCKADVARLKAEGVVFTDEPKEEPWGIGASFKDLYGNTWYLNEPR